MAVAAAAEKAVRCLGGGFDMTCDMSLKYCKDAGGCLVERGGVETAPLAVPGVGTVAGAPADVKCGKGDRVRLKSGVLEFSKMSELFNQRSSVEGKIPSGLFNACFDLDSGAWAQDAPATKCLAMDGYFISLFDLRLDRRPLALADHVLRDVPAAWDPAAIASGRMIVQVHREVRDACGRGAEHGRAGRGVREAARVVGSVAVGDQGASRQARRPALHRGLRHASPARQVQRQA